VRFEERLGTPGACYATTTLLKGDDAYTLTSIGLSLSRASRQEPGAVHVVDVRGAGLFSAPVCDKAPADLLNMLDGQRRTAVEQDGSKVVLTIEDISDDTGAPLASYRWEFDANRDYAVTRARAETDGIVQESVSELADYGDLWFPRKVTYLRDGTVTAEVEILDGDFSAPGEDSFGFGDMELLSGVQLPTLDEKGRRNMRIWDGQKFVSPREWFATADQSERVAWESRMKATDYGASPLPFRTAQQWDAMRITRRPGLWEEYVRAFIREHTLDTSRIRKAWEVHKECQRLAYRFMKDHEPEQRKLDEQIASVRSEPAGDLRDRRLEELDKLRDKLLDPIDDIFRKQLRPRLEMLAR